jgi:hypothetical protein
MPVDEKQQEIDESWEFSSGLLDDVDAVVVGTEFGYRPEYVDAEGNQLPLFILKLQAEGSSDVVESHYSIGRGWEVAADGRSVSKPEGKQKFVQTSAYAMLLARAAGLWPEIKRRGPTTRTGLFEGTKWHWEREKVEYGGQIGSKERLLPTKFLGVDEKAAAGAGGGGQDDLIAELQALAVSSDTHKDFIRAFTGNKELQAKVKAAGGTLLREVLDGKDTGFWAKTRKELVGV